MDLEQSDTFNQSLNNPHLEYLIEETKIQRWSNWVKFISLFTMVESVGSLIGNTLVEFIPTFDKEGHPFLVLFFVNFISFTMGYFGYITSISKNSKITLNYLIAMILSIILQVILTFYYMGDIVEASCEKKHKDCDKDDSLIVYYILCCLIVICCCGPIMYCPYRLYKSTKELEGKLRRDQDIELNDSGFSSEIKLKNSIRSFK